MSTVFAQGESVSYRVAADSATTAVRRDFRFNSVAESRLVGRLLFGLSLLPVLRFTFASCYDGFTELGETHARCALIHATS